MTAPNLASRSSQHGTKPGILESPLYKGDLKPGGGLCGAVTDNKKGSATIGEP